MLLNGYFFWGGLTGIINYAMFRSGIQSDSYRMATQLLRNFNCF
jgi:hypothetical protein